MTGKKIVVYIIFLDKDRRPDQNETIRASSWGARLEKIGIFDRDIFLIMVKGLSPFRHFTIIKTISRLNVRHAFQASYPKLDSRETILLPNYGPVSIVDKSTKHAGLI